MAFNAVDKIFGRLPNSATAAKTSAELFDTTSGSVASAFAMSKKINTAGNSNVNAIPKIFGELNGR